LEDRILPGSPLVDEARRIIDAARDRGLRLRAMGGIGVLLTLRGPDLLQQLGRGPINDIDLVGTSDERVQYQRLFEDLGYEVDRALLVVAEGRRYGFQTLSDHSIHVDVFIDRLEMCHTLDLRLRLGFEPYSLSTADLMLQKLQVVDLKRKDLVDLVALLLDSRETIDLPYISGILADDWGFCHTAATTLDVVDKSIGELDLSPNQADTVRIAMKRLRSAVEAAPKTRRWKIRAAVGTRMRWYQPVDDPESF
jgi:hypothetical protein